jgi:hypothetical protein
MEHEMKVEDMRTQFEGEWILVEDPHTNEALEVVSGKVLHHGKDRDEVYREAVARRPKRSAILFTGQMPQNTAIVL